MYINRIVWYNIEQLYNRKASFSIVKVREAWVRAYKERSFICRYTKPAYVRVSIYRRSSIRGSFVLVPLLCITSSRGHTQAKQKAKGGHTQVHRAICGFVKRIKRLWSYIERNHIDDRTSFFFDDAVRWNNNSNIRASLEKVPREYIRERKKERMGWISSRGNKTRGGKRVSRYKNIW